MTNIPHPTAQHSTRFFFLSAALIGAAILIIEIIGAKILAPYFGNSHYIWTAQITTTLLAHSIGYYLGALTYQKAKSLDNLYLSILLAAIYLIITTYFRATIATLCLATGVAFGSLLASILLYFIPFCLLTTTGPILVNHLTANRDAAGQTAGRLSAINAIGCVFGCLLVGYITLPLLPNSTTLYSTAAALSLLAAFYFKADLEKLSKQKLCRTAAVLLLLPLSLLILGAFSSNPAILCKANSNFGELVVSQKPQSNIRTLTNNRVTQNNYNVTTKQSADMFTYTMCMLTESYTPNLNSVLAIGLGIGSCPAHFRDQKIATEVIEINPKILQIATTWFGLQTNHMQIHIADGRQFLQSTAKNYNAIILDAFDAENTPAHLITQEAFRAFHQHLTTNGTLIINMVQPASPTNEYLVGSIYHTLKTVFPTVIIHQGKTGNSICVASSRTHATPIHHANFSTTPTNLIPTIRDALATTYTPNPKSGHVLTDDFNPIDYYNAKSQQNVRTMLSKNL